MANNYTQALGEYPYTNELRSSEGSRPKRYIDPGVNKEAIGYGHLIEGEAKYSILAAQLGFKDKENLTEKERRTLLKYDVNLRRTAMSKEYPESSQGIRDAMLTVRYQFSPDGFDDHFGDALRTNNKEALKIELERLGKVFKERKLGGVYDRWKRVQTNLDSLEE